MWTLLPISGGFLGLLGLLFRQYRTYRRMLERDTQPFVAYVRGGIRLRIERRVNNILAARFTLREWAIGELTTFPRYLAVPTENEDLRLDIDTLYTPLSMTAADRSDLNDDRLLESFSQSLLILGDPGSGKSSILKKHYRQALKSAITASPSAPTPLWVELKSVSWPIDSQDSTPSLFESMTTPIRTNRVLYKPNVLLDVSLTTRGFLLLLDGLDEVKSTSIDAACSHILGLLTWLKHNSPATKCIVTARAQFARQLPRQLTEAFDEVATIRPFTSTSIWEFLGKWPFPPIEREAEMDRLWTHLRDQPTLGEMCTNPLILSMYVVHDQRFRSGSEEGTPTVSRLPETRASFYSLVLGELLVFRRQQQQRLGPGRQSLREFYERLLGRMALDHILRVEEAPNELPLETVLDGIADVTGSTRESARTVLDDLERDTGVIIESQKAETIVFMHRSICEYFAGLEVAEERSAGWNQLISTTSRLSASGGDVTRTWEVMAFATALVSREQRRISLADIARAFPRYPELLLRCVRDSQAYDFDGILWSVDEVSGRLTRMSPDRWDQEDFAAFTVVLSVLEESTRYAGILRRPNLLSVREFLDSLIAPGTVSPTELVRASLIVNARVAVRIIAELNMDIADLPAEAMIRAAAEWDFLSYALDQVTSQRTGQNGRLRSVLAEASLRYAFVARTLLDRECPEDMWSELNAIPRSWSWQRSLTLNKSRSLFAALLTLSTEREYMEGNVRPLGGVFPASEFERVRFLSMSGREIIRIRMFDSFRDGFGTARLGPLTAFSASAVALLAAGSVGSVLPWTGLVAGVVFVIVLVLVFAGLSYVMTRALRSARLGVPQLADLPQGFLPEERYMLNVDGKERVRLDSDLAIFRSGGRVLGMVSPSLFEELGSEKLSSSVASARIPAVARVLGSGVGRPIVCRVEDNAGVREIKGVDLAGLTVSRAVAALIGICEERRIVEISGPAVRRFGKRYSR